MLAFHRLQNKKVLWRVRCWLKKNDLHEDTEQLELDVLNFSNTIPDHADLKFIAQKVVERFAEQMSAIEVTDDCGLGELIYTEWP